MPVLDRFDMSVANTVLQDSTTMSQARTISLFPLSLIGIALLILGPVLIKGQISSTSTDTSPYKGFSGLWVRKDSTKQVYYHDQTVAVVELGPGKSLENCELVEVTTPKEVDDTIKGLRRFSEPITITFEDMMQLIKQCHDFISPLETYENSAENTRVTDTVFQGIVPGTKWCGNSDIAKTYFDLGKEKDVDKCCRTHDLCPVKVRSYRTRYNLTNNQFYTKSHCDCDNRLLQCLKTANTPLARLMGNVYFNIMRIPCVEETTAICESSVCKRKKFRNARQFT